MRKRLLGQLKLEVSSLGLGCMGMSMGYGVSDDQQSIKVIQHAVERGINFFDTSDLYGAGHNEALIRKALSFKSVRDNVVIATKCGFVEMGKVDGSAEHIKTSCEASLKRLGVDVIDLYYLHRADKNTPIEESVGALRDLVIEGKIRHIGLSEVTPETLQRACAVHPITALQSEYSLWHRKPELEILKACRALGVGFVPYSPLSRGFLSGQYRTTSSFDEGDFRKVLDRFQPENLEHNLILTDKIIELGRRLGCSAAQLSLAWLLAQGEDIVPIPGTRSIARLDENLGAIELQLPSIVLEEISKLIPVNAILGKQYPPAYDFEL